MQSTIKLNFFEIHDYVLLEVEDEEKVIEYVYVDFEDFMSFKATSRTSDFDDLIQNYIEFVDERLYHHQREVLNSWFTVKEERKLKLYNLNHLDSQIKK